jgi:hypothetical protein
MTFLNPAILFGLIAAGIPLIIHLFNFRRPRTVDFSSPAFLTELKRETMRRLRVRQWFLLLLRTLAIACLVLAFARPTVKSGLAGRIATTGRTSVAVVLDNSTSMLQRDQRGAFLSQAQDELLSLAADLDAGDELAISLLVSDPDRPIFELASPALASDWLEGVEALDGRPDLNEAVDRALEWLERSDHSVLELFIISDLQSVNFTDSLTREIPASVRSYLVPVGSAVADNVAVTSVEVASSIVDVGQPVHLKAEVANFGENDLRNWGVSAYLAEERVAQSTIDLSPGQRASVDLVLTPSQRGWLSGYIAIEDDRHLFDNRRYFTLHVPEVRRVLIVRGADAGADYFELALSRELSSRGSVFAVESVEESGLSSVPLETYDAVVLHGLRSISSGQVTAITNFVTGGGGLFLFLGESGANADYQTLIRQLGGGLVSGIVGSPRTRDRDAALATLARIDEQHPLFTGVFETEEESHDVGNPAVFRSVTYRAGGGDEHTVIETTAGNPVLQEIRGNSGRVLMMPFLADPAWTELPLKALFVPLVHRAMYYITSSDEASGEGIVAGSGASYRLNASSGDRVVIRSIDGNEWIPDQRGGIQGLVLNVPFALREPGVYEILSDEVLRSRIAVNAHPGESDLRRSDPTGIAALIGAGSGSEMVVLGSGSPDATAIQAGSSESNVEIWNVFLALALVFLVAEMLVAKR